MKNKIKYLLSLVVTFAAFGNVSAGELTVATVNNGHMIVMQELTKHFEEDNPGITVNWVTLDEGTLRQRVTTDITTKGGQFDIMTIGMYEAPIWGAKDWLEVLDFDSSYDVDDILPAMRGGLSANGNLYADKEIIICAGSFVTPKILMLSGIGDKDELKNHDIKCIQHLPGVGKNLMDHPESILIAKANGKHGYFKQDKGLRMLRNGIQFFMFGSGVVNSTGVEAGAFINPLDDKELPNVQASFVPIMYMNPDTIGVVDEDYGMTISNVLTKPKSKGFVKLKSNNYLDPPIIEPNLLKHPDDLKLMIAAQKFYLDVLNSKPLSNKIDKIVLPSDKKITNDVLENHCKKFVKTNYHPSGTAKMGADNDNESVLDAKMRVKGIDNLRVSDLSAMPIISSGNTSAPAMMLGMRCGELINKSN